MLDSAKLSALLKQKGLLTDQEIQTLSGEAQKMNVSLFEYLYVARPVDIAELSALIAGQYQIPLKKFDADEKVPSEILKLLPEESAKNYKAICFDKNAEGLYVGVVDPEIPRLKEGLEFAAKRAGVKLRMFFIAPTDFYRLVAQYHSFDEEIKKAVESFQGAKTGPGTRRSAPVNIEFIDTAATEDAPIIRLVSAIIRQAVVRGASDIHFEPFEDAFRVRLRLEGKLQKLSELPKELGGSVTTRLKVMAELKLDETRVPQDGRIRAFIEGREIDFRIATLPTPNGEAIAIRILDSATGLKKLADLGLAEYHGVLLDRAVERPYGMVVVAGPTGSGKTTTQYAILQRLNQESKNIITLEDPIEYRIRGVNQSQIKPEIGYTFASGLRQILRQDPNIILVGEVRDEETAELAIHAALTGHLVFTTLHANDAAAIIPRLLDLKVRRFLIPSTLILLMSQRLMRKLCPECRKKEDALPALEKEIDAALKGVPKEIAGGVPAKPYTIYRPGGCDKCGGSGYKGRIGLFEVIEMTSELARAILVEGGDEAIKVVARTQGTISLRQDGILKALQGLVTVEEVLKETV